MQSIPCGPVVLLQQNVVYALPSATCQLLTESVCQTSPTVNGTFTDMTGSNVEPGVRTSGGFIRCATGNTNVVVKRHTLSKTGIKSYEDTVKGDGAIYYWKLNETSGTNIVDVVGGKNGTITGGVTLGVAGVSSGEKAAEFDGTGYITIPNLPMPLQWTQEVWLRVTSLPASARQMLSRDNYITMGTEFFCIVDQLRGVIVGLTGGSKQQIAFLTTAASTSVWHHAVMTHDGTTWKLYWDKVFQVSLAVATEPDLSPLTTCIGSNGHGDLSQTWIGRLQDVAMYPFALSQAQISSHYDAKKK